MPRYEGLEKRDYFTMVPDLDPLWRAEPEVSRFLGDLAFLTDARNVLETGCFVGATTSHLAHALAAPGGLRDLYFIDQSQRFRRSRWET